MKPEVLGASDVTGARTVQSARRRRVTRFSPLAGGAVISQPPQELPCRTTAGRHVRIATSLFAGLGFQVGLLGRVVPELVASRGLSPGGLGVALGVLAVTSILSLGAAGVVADRIGRRPLACAGAARIGLALLALAAVQARWALLPTVALYGLANGLLDLGANTIGADVGREHRVRVMIRLHAGFQRCGSPSPPC